MRPRCVRRQGCGSAANKHLNMSWTSVGRGSFAGADAQMSRLLSLAFSRPSRRAAAGLLSSRVWRHRLELPSHVSVEPHFSTSFANPFSLTRVFARVRVCCARFQGRSFVPNSRARSDRTRVCT